MPRRVGITVIDWLAARSVGDTVALGLVGVLIGTAIVFAEPIAHWIGGLAGVGVGSVYNERARAYLRRQETALWLFLLCGQVGFWAVLLVPIARTLRRVRRWWTAWGVAGYVGVVIASAVIVTVAAATLVHFPYGLPGHEHKIEIITTLGLGVAALGAAGVSCIARGAQELQQQFQRAPPAADGAWQTAVRTCLELRAALDGLLVSMAAIIGAAILSTGALRNATIAWQQALGSTRTADAIFPQDQVLAYGIVFSAALGLLYLPVYERLGAAATQLRDLRAPLIWPPMDGWQARAQERSMLDRVLKLDQGATTSFRIAAGVLAPLASSLISRALG